MQANADLHEVVSDKAAQFMNYVVCVLQERGEDGRWRERERERETGFPDGLAVSSSSLRHCPRGWLLLLPTTLPRCYCHPLFLFHRDWTIWESWVWTKPTVPRAFIFFQLFSFQAPAAHKASLHRPATVCIHVLYECVWAHIINFEFYQNDTIQSP